MSICSSLRALFRQVPATIWWAVVAGLMLHAAGLLMVLDHVGTAGLIRGDAIGYLKLAENLADGTGWGLTGADGVFRFEAFRTPGLPWLISLFLRAGAGLEGYLWFLTLVSALVLPLAVWYIARALFDARVAVVAAWLIVLEPFTWFFSWQPLTEMPFLLLSLFGVACLVRAYQSRSGWSAVLTGALFAASVYVRPAIVPILGVVLLALIGHALYRRAFGQAARMVLVAFAFLLALAPWLSAMHAHTGVYAVSGTGWRNVYTDYLASVRAIELGTNFSEEKNALKAYAYTELGLTPATLNGPQGAPIVRAYALNELMEKWPIVLRLEPMLLVSYFTNTGYWARASALGLAPEKKSAVGISQAFAERGIGALPVIYKDLRQRYFIPLIERMLAFAMLVFAVLGLVRTRSAVRYLFLAAIGIGAFTSTAIGLGVEGRLRLPVLPYYYMLAAYGMLYFYGYVCDTWPRVRARCLRARV